MMFAVMDLHGPGINMGLERIIGVGKLGQFKAHRSVPPKGVAAANPAWRAIPRLCESSLF
jgi:hypothetical protein